MLTSQGQGDILVARLDAAGRFTGGIAAGGLGEDSGNAVATDAAGNVHVAGSFSSTAQFAATWVTSAGSSDAFVWKLRP
jgi:hypothetical protein